MIVLDGIAPATRGIRWRVVPCRLPGAHDEGEVLAKLASLGVTRTAALESEAETGFAHAWSTEGDSLVYETAIAHRSLTPSTFSFYLSAVLGTVVWARIEDLLALHLGLYEIIVNVHDHGTPITPEGVVRLRLAIGERDVRGSLTDDCARFDPRDLAAVDVGERATQRQRRGYGVTLIRRTLDHLEFGYGPKGNLVNFTKRIES